MEFSETTAMSKGMFIFLPLFGAWLIHNYRETFFLWLCTFSCDFSVFTGKCLRLHALLSQIFNRLRFKENKKLRQGTRISCRKLSFMHIHTVLPGTNIFIFA